LAAKNIKNVGGEFEDHPYNVMYLGDNQKQQ
jgi:hypothetical protein